MLHSDLEIYTTIGRTEIVFVFSKCVRDYGLIAQAGSAVLIAKTYEFPGYIQAETMHKAVSPIQFRFITDLFFV